MYSYSSFKSAISDSRRSLIRSSEGFGGVMPAGNKSTLLPAVSRIINLSRSSVEPLRYDVNPSRWTLPESLLCVRLRISASMRMTFLPVMPKVTEKFREMKVFPSPGLVEVNIITRASFCMKLRLKRNILNDSLMGSDFWSPTTISLPFMSSFRCGISPNTGMVV